jgi:hypothetical protein
MARYQSGMADWIPLTASIVVGVVFLVAGATKIAAGAEWPAQARGLGAPAIIVPLVPWVEVATGAVLVVQVARRAAAFAAAAMQLAQGRRPPCACFGAWSVKPLGAGHVVRNVALIALSVLALF